MQPITYFFDILLLALFSIIIIITRRASSSHEALTMPSVLSKNSAKSKRTLESSLIWLKIKIKNYKMWHFQRCGAVVLNRSAYVTLEDYQNSHYFQWLDFAAWLSYGQSVHSRCRRSHIPIGISLFLFGLVNKVLIHSCVKYPNQSQFDCLFDIFTWIIAVHGLCLTCAHLCVCSFDSSRRNSVAMTWRATTKNICIQIRASTKIGAQ